MISRREHNFWVSYAAWSVVVMMGFCILCNAPIAALVSGAILAAGITSIMYMSEQK